MIPYEKEIRIYLEALKILEPKLVILFGSIAKKKFGVGSDVDLLVVSDKLPENFKERMNLLYELDKTNAPLDVKAYKSDEVKKMLIKGNPTILDALEDGIILFAEKDFLGELMELYEAEKRRFRRFERGWIRVG
ncbi:MAG: nucleotidyltransferase domain-containing protein [Archaeoglobaceae archaeon]